MKRWLTRIFLDYFRHWKDTLKWVLFSILFFGGLFGFVGMLIGVPVFAVIYDLIRQLIVRGLELRNKSKMFDEYELEYPRKD